MFKIKKIAALCTSGHAIKIEDTQDGNNKIQWIGNGYAMYRMGGIPYLQERTAFAMFDIDENKREKFNCSHNAISDFDHLVRDVCDKDIPLRETNITIKYKSKTVTGLDGKSGIILVHPKYLAPLDDLGEVTLWQRATTKGRSLIVAKEGLFTVAIIAPSFNIFEDGAYDLKRIANVLDELEVEDYEEYMEG